jgi:hypothetical protein
MGGAMSASSTSEIASGEWKREYATSTSAT